MFFPQLELLKCLHINNKHIQGLLFQLFKIHIQQADYKLLFFTIAKIKVI
jgi:hypothetical protein